MASKHGKRTNLNRVPISANSIDEERIIAEVSVGNMYYAWLLLIPVLIEQEGTPKERIVELWNIVNDYASNSLVMRADVKAATKHIESVIGYKTPYPTIDFRAIRTQGDLESIKRKLKKNALHAALCTIALGLQSTGQYSDEQLRRIFFNADLTLAEISNGMTSYVDLSETVRKYGIVLSEGRDDMELQTVTG